MLKVANNNNGILIFNENIKKKAVSENAWDEYEDVLETCFGGDHKSFLEDLIMALGDNILTDHLEYIKRMRDYDSIKQEMESGE